MESFLLTGGAAFVVAFVVGFVFATTNGRLGVVLALGVGLAIALFVLAAVSAPAERPERCSDCTEWLGGWWEPALVVTLLVINLIAWTLAATIASYVRRRSGRSASA